MKDSFFKLEPAKSTMALALIVLVAVLTAVSVEQVTAAPRHVEGPLIEDCPPGYTCFYNDGPAGTLHSRIGKIRGNNRSWYFGRGKNWQSMADYFYNKGTSGMNICIYPKTNFRGSPILVVRKSRIAERQNFGRSNKWVWGYGCPWYGY